MNFSKSSKSKQSALMNKNFKNKQTNTENLQGVDKCTGTLLANSPATCTSANNLNNEYSHQGILLDDYVKAMDYINSCHSIINEIIQTRTPGSGFSMPRMPNFLSAYSVINKSSKETIHENMESVDEYSRNDSKGCNVRTNATDSDVDLDSRAMTDCNDLVFTTDDELKKDNVPVATTKSRTSSIPRPVSSERCYRPKNVAEDESTMARQSISISQVKNQENKKAQKDKSMENKQIVMKAENIVPRTQNQVGSRLRPSTVKEVSKRSVSDPRRKVRDAHSKSPCRSRVSAEKIIAPKIEHVSRSSSERSISKPEVCERDKIIVSRPYSSKHIKPDIGKNKINEHRARKVGLRESPVKKNDSNFKTVPKDHQKLSLNSTASIRHIQQKLAETDLNCNEGIISQDDLEKFANDLISTSSAYDSPTSRSPSPSSPKPYKSSSKSRITYKTKSDHSLKPVMKSKSRTSTKPDTKNAQKHRKSDLIEKLSAMIDKVETTERRMKLKNDTNWRHKFGKCLSTKSRAKQLISELSACQEKEEEEQQSQNSVKSSALEIDHDLDFVTNGEMDGSPFMVDAQIEQYTNVIEEISDIEPDDPDLMLMSIRNSINNKSQVNTGHPMTKQQLTVQYVVKEKPNDFFTARRPTKSFIMEQDEISEIFSDHDDPLQMDEESDIDDDVFEDIKNDLSTIKMRNSVLENPAESVQKSVLATLGLLKKLGTGKQDNREELEMIKQNMSKTKMSFRQPRLKKVTELEEEVIHLDITAVASSHSSDIKSDREEKLYSLQKGSKKDQRK